MKRYAAAGAVPLFCLTSFFCAGLLFAVEPYAAKKLLPYAGGSPLVWNSAVTTFQTLLLLGYLGAFAASRLRSIRLEALLIVVLFWAAWLYRIPRFSESDLEIILQSRFVPLRVIQAIITTIGPIFFALSLAGPTIQRWYSRGDYYSSRDTYFLYAASNTGSLAALLAYPLVVEPNLALNRQAAAAGLLFTAVTVLISVCAAMTAALATERSLEQKSAVPPISAAQVSFWLLLSAVPSGLLLSTTSYLTTDIAPIPLLWVVPLALYLATFIVAFARFGKFSARTEQGAVLLAAIVAIFLAERRVLELWIAYPLHLAAFFLVCLTLHSMLAARRPEPSRLTFFFLIIAAGGLLGGAFVTLAAPLLFNYSYEYLLFLALFLLLRCALDKTKQAEFLRLVFLPMLVLACSWAVAAGIGSSIKPYGFLIPLPALLLAYRFVNVRAAFAAVVIPLFFISCAARAIESSDILNVRDYFGTMRVFRKSINGEAANFLAHGTTIHGEQFLKSRGTCTPVNYYARSAPGGEFLETFGRLYPEGKVAVIGLGAGAAACYAAPDQHWTFIELSPTVAAIAGNENYFTFLKTASAKHLDVLIGDGRLTLARFDPDSLDLIFGDAFSSDSVPLHLLTREAFELYQQKLKRHGTVLLHVPNRYLNFGTQLADVSAATGIRAVRKGSWVALSRNELFLEALRKNAWAELVPGEAAHCWTDTYSNIVEALYLP